MPKLSDIAAMYIGDHSVVKAYRGDQQVWPIVDDSDTSNGDLDLPREAWYGGSAYYSQFSAAASQGWNNASFFPFVMFPNSFIGNSEVGWDARSANVYHGANEWSTWQNMSSNGMTWIGGQLETREDLGGPMPANYPGWVGYAVEDEIDGTRDNPVNGLADASAQVASFNASATGRFVFANYTQRILQDAWVKPGGGFWGADFVNLPGVDVVCIDMYWYTIPDSSFYNGYVSGGDTIKGPGARMAGSYGACIRATRWLDAQDGSLKPIWMYIENLSGSPGEQFVRYIEPAELKAAVMSCITNGASGIVWFNNVASSTHYVANVSRTAQMDSESPAAARVRAAQEIKAFVESLAPVINTQSYVWDFGSSTIDTMLKTYDGYAYIFAVPGTGNGTGPTLGLKTFQLPSGVTGDIEVIGESRSITPSGSTFTDTFANEYTWHVYKIALG